MEEIEFAPLQVEAVTLEQIAEPMPRLPWWRRLVERLRYKEPTEQEWMDDQW